MKKLLLTLSSVLIVGGAAGSVISCGVKPEKEVTFMIFGTTSSAGDQEKRKNFQDLADEFNALHKNEKDFVPVQVVMKNSNYLNLAIQSGDNLPDLYVSYVDAASTYVDSSVGNQVRDMKESMGEGFNAFNEDLITSSFMEEGQYKGEQIVLPFGKSFDISVINVNLFIQFMDLFQVETNALKTNFKEFNDIRKNLLDGSEKWEKTKIFKENSKFSTTKSEENEINTVVIRKELYDKLFEELNKINTVDDIKAFFNSTKNVLMVAEAFKEAVKKGIVQPKVTLNETNKEVITTKEDYHFAFGMDSIDNKYYMDYAATTFAPEGVINVQNSISTENPEEGFWYHTTYNDNNDKIAEITLNANSQGFKNTTEYLQGMKTIALNDWNDTLASSNWRDQWNGVFSTARKTNSTQNFVTEDFVKSTMFMASASSANDIYFTDQFKNKAALDKDGNTITATYRPVSKADVITTATTNGENTDKNVFLSQGRGIAGFKSNGSNAAEKEKSVTEFLNYIMQPIQTAQYGLKTSYMPATKSGMKIYENYKNGNYNNTKGEATNSDQLKQVVSEIEGIDKQYVTDELLDKYFYQIKNITGEPEVKAGVSSVITSFIEDYLDPMIYPEKHLYSSKVALVSSKAIPTTDIIRSSLKSATTGNKGLLDLSDTASRNANMNELLVEGNNYYNLSSYLKSYENKEFFRQIKITFTPIKNN
ncbi:unknown lipoprotein [Mesoplasma florum W37]|uniref:Lipoprotein n=1 Tax=Mesoplasma florum TaxID=2151 RepID=A0AAD0MPI1_MESFO|nr:unknown lipoprotein [Mesoplasma florum]AGY41088.1 unknown lipoprotein [Mesoplasma florum W37]AVN65426.1 hypothetical protein MflW12_0210 [Mesoplasma florum]